MSKILCNFVLIIFHVANIKCVVLAMNDNANDNKFLRQFITIFKALPLEKKNEKNFFDCDEKDIVMGLMSHVLLGNE